MYEPRNYTFSDDTDNLKIALLLKDSALNLQAVTDNYIDNLLHIPVDKIVALSLKYNANNKISAKDAKEYLVEILDGCISLGIDTLYVCDSAYFKYLTKVTKVEPCFGEVMPCLLDVKYEHMSVILGVNYQATFYDPKQQVKLVNSLETLEAHFNGTFVKPGMDIIHYSRYLKSPDYISLTNMLYDFRLEETLAVDIEATSLRFDKGKLWSIAFAYSQHKGCAAMIVDDEKSKKVLKEFFTNFTGKLIYHNGLFDIKYLVYHLFMDHDNDFKGMFEGIEIMTRNIDDTMLMTYLTTNSTAGNVLGLKPNTQEFTGDYAEDVKDVTIVPVDDLLEYNLKDTLATFWLYNKRSKELITEGQVEIYNDIFLPAIPVLLEMMLVGLPMDMDRVNQVSNKLFYAKSAAEDIIMGHEAVTRTTFLMQIKAMMDTNAKLKRSVKNLSHFNDPFNPGSGLQKQKLFYEVMGLPVLDLTDSGQPSTSGKTIKKLLAHCLREEDKELLQAFKDFQDTDKILGTFIKAFKDYKFMRGDATTWLNGNQKLGGTLSGRLASNEPNLANLPSNSKYGKDIKSCFVAPEGYLFCGSDYAALEDRVVAIISGDPNKRRIFTDGIDGHCLNAYGYFSAQMPDINPDDPDSINSIKHVYPDLRQESKSPTFALNYAGTHITLHHNCGIPMAQAKEIEAGHQELYKVMHAWGQANKKLMAKDGFITGAYGLKVRTPALARALLDSRITPNMVKAEFRSANNAVTQSHGLMTTVAGIKFKEILDKSIYRYDILMMNFIHDAIYLLVKDDVEVISWVNKTLIECMNNAGDEQVKDFPGIPLSANLDIGRSWDKQLELPNNATNEEIEEVRSKL